MGLPDHLTYLLRNLNVGQEATVRALLGTNNWFKIACYMDFLGAKHFAAIWRKLFSEI